MKKEKPKYSVINNMIYLVKDIAKAYPLLLLFLFLEIILSVITPVFGMYLPKIAIELATEQAAIKTVIGTIGGVGFTMSVLMALSSMANEGKYFMYNGMRNYYRIKLFFQSLECDYIHIESPEGQTKYSRARESLNNGDWSGTSRLTVAMVDFFVAVLSFIVYASIITNLSVFIITVLILLSGINLISTRRAQNFEHQQKDEEARLNKQMSYVEHTACDWKWGKDIRLYGMSDWLLQLRENLLNLYAILSNKIRGRYFSAGVIHALTLFLRDGLAYGYLIWTVYTKGITVGEFVLYFGAITGFSGFVSRIADNINQLNGANLQMNDLRAFLDNTDEAEPHNKQVVMENEAVAIEFRNVSFAYSKESDCILRDFNMTLKAGEKVALVGVNGAGKTTIIKLLCKFYKPDRGNILIHGVDIEHLSKKQVFHLISAVFQDIYIAPFTVAENISMKPISETDLEKVTDCLKKCGLYEVIAKYPEREQSFMLKEVNDGMVLSGGQQQKLLLSRALYKDAPILILDEPTAALDPIAESETYQSFQELAGEKTSIYISHRLASTKFCDKIILLQDGTAKEIGTHEQLLKLDGEYAKMFMIQSHYYNNEVVTEHA